MDAALVPIPPSEAAALLNKIVHVQGWPNGCQFRLERIEGGQAHLITPKTGRRYVVALERLAYTRKREP